MNPNPFDQDGVIRVLLEECDMPTLKTLRELNTNWSSLDLKELENRAIKGELREINFSFYRVNQKTLEEAKEEIAQFLDGTQAIPQLFRAFHLHFPQSLKLLNASFFSKYPPMFIYLDLNSLFLFNEDTSKLLLNFLSWVAPSLKELCIGTFYRDLIKKDVNRSNWWKPEDFSEFPEIPQGRLNFPKLNKFSMNLYTKGLSQFRVILDKGGEVNPSPNLKELAIGELDTDFGELFGLGTRSMVGYQRWTTLKHLTLYTHLFSNLGAISEAIENLCILSQYGMTLNYLDLELVEKFSDLSHLSSFCVILSQFLESQSAVLQHLRLSFSFNLNRTPQDIPEQEFEEYQTSIRLPIFPKLLRLKFHMLIIKIDKIDQNPLQMGPIPIHFPNLKTFEIHHLELDIIKDLFKRVNLEPWPVQEIVFCDNPSDENFDWLRANFRSVLKFDYFRLLVNAKSRLEYIPWAYSLEHLRINSVRAPIKITHHRNLKYIKVSDSHSAISKSKNVYRKSVHSYLENFQEVLGLNLIKITFQTDKEICGEVKGHISSYFPFEVEFKNCSVTNRFF